MNRFALGLGLLALLLGMGTRANADPLGLFPLGPSKPSELITLLSTLPGSPPCPRFQVHFDRVLESDGTTTPFAGIPAGMVLVVTGFDWNAAGTPANLAVTGEISVQTEAVATQLLRVTSTSDGSGRAGGQIHGQNIAAIASGPSICFGVNSSISTEAARLYGYLTADE
ncbi:MAG: hypothetical protein ACREQY_05985 [Candidatus Binatia bacterium]